MPEEPAETSPPEIAHVLLMEILGGDDAREKLAAELNDVVRQGTRFRVSDAAGKLICATTESGMTVAFFESEPEAALECAVETTLGLKAHPQLKVRMGIHSALINRVRDLTAAPKGYGIETVRQLTALGDDGHILLSKKSALELAPMPRWNTHLYELGEMSLDDDEKISLVNFYTDWAGNPQEPAKLKHAHARAARREKLRSLGKTLSAAAMLLSILAVAAGIYFYAKGKLHIGPAWAPWPPEKSIAVLPLVDLSPAHDQEYFCDGISEEILNALAKFDALRVIARNSSFAFKGKNGDVREVGRRLHAAAILTGTLRREENQVRLTTQLFNAQDGSEIAAWTMEKELANAHELVDDAATATARAMRVRFSTVPQIRRPFNVQAYDFFLQGLFFSNNRSEEDLRHSIELFQLAGDQEPRLAAAWSGIAQDWISLGDSHVKPIDAYPRAETAAAKALAIDDANAEAHAYLGEARRVMNWDVRGDETQLQRALALKSSFANAHALMSILQAALGNRERQLDEIAIAARLDPLSPMIASLQVSALVANNRLDDAFNAAKRTMEIDPDYVYFEPALALVYREQGKLKEALEIYERLEQTRRNATAGLAITYARLGRKDDARRVVNELIDRANRYYFPGEQIAAVYVALGDNDEAFRWLARATDEHSPTLLQIAFAPEFRALRSDPRFTDALSRIGIDPAKLRQDRQ